MPGWLKMPLFTALRFIFVIVCKVSAEEWEAEGKGGWKRRGRSNSRHQSQTGFRDHPIGAVQITHLDLGEEFGQAEEEKGC